MGLRDDVEFELINSKRVLVNICVDNEEFTTSSGGLQFCIFLVLCEC